VAWGLAVGLAPELALIIGLVGGIIGWIMMYAIFDTALVLLTSLVGAHMIVEQFHLNQPNEMLVLIVLTVVGVLLQTRKREPLEQKTRVVHHHHYHRQT
jgi:CheY-specific phosphatase CheX